MEESITLNTNEPIASSELGILWLTYQKKKMMLRMMDYFIEKTEDTVTKNIMSVYHNGANNFVAEIEGIFKKEGAVIPIAFGGRS